MVDHSSLKEFGVTRDDIRNVETIYGLDINSVKGKTVETTPKPVRMNIESILVSIISLYRHVMVVTNLIFVNVRCFLLFVRLKIKCITIKHIRSRHVNSLEALFLWIKKAYMLRGFTNGKTNMDPEFPPLTDNLSEHRILLNCYAENEHIPEIE